VSGRLRIGVSCYATVGGSGIIATEVGRELARRGHQVHFVCSAEPGRPEPRGENVTFHRVETVRYPLFETEHYTLALASKLVEVSRRERLHLVHVHYAVPHAASAYLARQILGASAPRLVTTLHGTDITLVGSDPSFLPITRFSILASDGLTTPSEALRAATYARLEIPEATPIEVIPNFVDTERFQPDEGLRGAARELFPRLPWQGARRPRLLIHNSNFRPLKRTLEVVRIAAAVRARTDAALVMVGDGPDRAAGEALARELGIADAVAFVGEQREVVPLLQRAELFLLPSAEESFGLAALEAMACGVPVVASRVGGLPEVIVDGECGALRPAGDIAAMAQAALELLEEPAWGRASAAARARAVDNFRRGPAVDRYEAVYRRVMARG
jgi:N-acetyl-alpha-D-glucosaminyl L-malate synthase BshA